MIITIIKFQWVVFNQPNFRANHMVTLGLFLSHLPLMGAVKVME
jgi:hypothetical protein